MKDITILIDKYGPELTRSLGIASAQLYSKLLWYVRVGGILNLVTYAISLLIGISLALVVYKLKKRVSVDYGDEAVTFYLVSTTIFVLVWILFSMIALAITKDAVRVISPEFWIIDQVVQKALVKQP